MLRKIEITPEMVEAGASVLRLHDDRFTDEREGAERIIRAALRVARLTD